MQITMLQGKIHRATVTQAELDYVGSITVDEDLLDAAGIKEYQLVQIILMAYAQMTPEEAKENKPNVVFVDDENKISRVTNYEKHGRLFDMERLG